MASYRGMKYSKQLWLQLNIKLKGLQRAINFTEIYYDLGLSWKYVYPLVAISRDSYS